MLRSLRVCEYSEYASTISEQVLIVWFLISIIYSSFSVSVHVCIYLRISVYVCMSGYMEAHMCHYILE